MLSSTTSPTAEHPSLRRRAVLLLVGLMATIGLLAACGSSGPAATGPAGTEESAAGVSGSITVFAAASLKDAFTELGEAFEAAHPDASVRFSFAASSALAQQISEGAPADVFASADEPNMRKVAEAGDLGGDPVVFATNSLEIIVAPGNPEGIGGLGDLAGPGVLYVTAAPEVPIGSYAARALQAADVQVEPVSLEADVKAVVTKVTSGEADAGIVYATDVAAAGDAAEGVAIPDSVNVVATYPMGVTAGTGDPATAAAWVAFATGPEGQAILDRYGFGAP